MQTSPGRGLFETKTSQDGRPCRPSKKDLKLKKQGRQGRHIGLGRVLVLYMV